MKVEENQRFTSFDFLTLVVSLVIVVGISAPIINRNFQPDNSVEKAKVSLVQIGQAMISPPNLSTANNRSVASVDPHSTSTSVDFEAIRQHLQKGEWEGDIGKDPWGRPYHFSFLRNSSGMHTHVAVWSDGPNQVNESSLHSQPLSGDQSSSVSFKGDDVGNIFPIR